MLTKLLCTFSSLDFLDVTMGTDGSSTGLLDSSTVKPPSQSEGIIARAVHDLFQTKNSLSNGSERVKVTMSYLEIYNEQVRGSWNMRGS